MPGPLVSPDNRAGSATTPAGGSSTDGAGGALPMGGLGVGGTPTAGGGGVSTAGGAGGAGSAVGGGGAGAAAGGSGGGPVSGAAGAGGSASSAPQRVLLYSFGTLAIESLQSQLQLFEDRLESWGYEVVRSKEPADIEAANLSRFAAVGMINTCFEPFGAGNAGTAQGAALTAFVEAGGGLFGTHCASVTFQSAQPPHVYNQLLGGRGGDGYFDGVSSCRTEGAHPTVSSLPQAFDYLGNLDNADYLGADTQVLVRCRWSTGAQKDVPVSWYRTPGTGRVFYTNFAKVDADLRDATIGEKHVFPGLAWVLGR